MAQTSSPTRSLSTAEQRRVAVLAAAGPVFAEKGFHAAPTAEIARAAGISQAYLFRLFPTKVELFVAVCADMRRRMLETFRSAAEAARRSGADVLEEMGAAYRELVLSDREALLIQMHSQTAASGEPEIRESARRTFAELYELVVEVSGAGPEELRSWFAEGMLINAMTAIGADGLEQPWSRALVPEDCVEPGD